jgi:beta-glucosidase
VSVEVQNVGKYKGDEVVQLYIHDVYASTSRPVKELKRFKRITLDVNEKKKVEFELMAEDLALLDENMKPVVEPGEFEVMVGGNSKDVLKESFWVVK